MRKSKAGSIESAFFVAIVQLKLYHKARQIPTLHVTLQYANSKKKGKRVNNTLLFRTFAPSSWRAKT